MSNRPSNRVELKFGNAIDDKAIGYGLEADCGNGIAKDVLRPRHRGRGHYGDVAGNQAKIAVFTWTQHHSIGPECHRLMEAIGGLVVNLSLTNGCPTQRDDE